MRLEMPCSQKDLTIQQLRDQVGQDSVTIQIPSAERLLDLQRQLADKERALQESQSQVCLKLHEAEDKISQLESALEHTQCELLKARGKSDTNGSRSDEMEMLMTDLERANQRAVVSEHHHQPGGRDQLSDMDSSSPPPPSTPRDASSSPVPSRASLELQLASKDKEISQLVEDIRKLQSAVDSLKETSASQIAQLEEMLAEKSRIIQELEDRLDRQKDYDDIKTELRNLKMLEDSDNPSDDQDEKPTLVPSNNNNNNNNNCVDLVLYGKHRMRLSPPLGKGGREDAGSPGSRLQNVEAFGSLLGEEIVSSFSRMLKSEPTPIVTSPPATPKSVDADAMSTGTDTSTGSGRVVDDVAGAANPPTPDAAAAAGVSLERLQDCLRQNMERHACEALNTQNVSRAVRELLSAHNVGQRMFARFVLGLSQGTVSELLSKPKPWDKLTEKGRDSYRKMHAWASDDFCVFMLKSLVPKKAKESGGSSASSRQEDVAAEERIAQILSEAQQAMTIPPNKERSPAPPSSGAQNGSADDSHADSDADIDGNSYAAPTTPQNLAKDAAKRSSRKYENDDIPQEMVARIYQEELAKLMGQRVEESFRQQQYDRTHEEIRQALSIYHHELSRLSQLALTPGHEFARFGAAALPGALLNGAFPGLSLGPELRGPGAASAAAAAAARAAAADSAEAMRAAHDQQQPPTSQHQQQHHHRRAASLAAQLAPRDWHKQRGGNKYSSAFSLVRPGVKFPGSTPSPPGAGVLGLSETPPGAAAAEDLGSSPLQRMQSITNSLLTQSAAPSMPSTNQRQAKAVLPPITQQQFDQYNNLNTEEIVKKVKEQLSQYSISQRLFGENVLGLSQGSVSDLLARPKPWHMLTQKGREPFIRMKIFLEDENAVHKLVASQYKIAPEKLMRTSGFTAASSPLAGSSKLPASSAAARAAAREQMPSHRNSHCDSAASSPLLGKSPFSASPELQVALMQQQHHHQQQQQQQQQQQHQQQQQDSRVSMYAPPSSPTAAARKGHGGHHPGGRSLAYVQPSVYEMAALTTDLDTQTITAKIKETLMAHNIGQKIFGEAVLGLSQGSVSELLSKPKPWHMLSIKGREPFIRMQLWLNDPHNVEKLQVIKNERREANKRRRTHVDLDAAPRPLEAQPPSLPAMTASGSFPFAPPSSPFPAAKKPRVLFSDEQKEALRLAFSMDPYPSTATIEFLAAELGLSVRTITNWFHNHRMRLKQHVVSPGPDENQPRAEPSPTLLAPPAGSRESAASFDPALFRGLLVQRLAEMQGAADKSGPAAFGGSNSGAGNCSAISLNAYNSYSPSSQQGNDEGTLDLSMSSQTSSGRKTWGRGGGTPTEDLDDSNLSQDEQPAGSDRDSLKEENLVSPTMAPRSMTTTMSQHNSHSSRRRKPAAPKWVDPGLSPDSDDGEDDETGTHGDDDCGARGGDGESTIINGVCVRQTAGDFGLRLHETVRVDPVAASDDASTRKTSEREDMEEDDEEEEEEEEESALELCTTTKKQSSASGDGIRKLEQRLDHRGEERGEDWEF